MSEYLSRHFRLDSLQHVPDVLDQTEHQGPASPLVQTAPAEVAVEQVNWRNWYLDGPEQESPWPSSRTNLNTRR